MKRSLALAAAFLVATTMMVFGAAQQSQAFPGEKNVRAYGGLCYVRFYNNAPYWQGATAWSSNPVRVKCKAAVRCTGKTFPWSKPNPLWRYGGWTGKKYGQNVSTARCSAWGDRLPTFVTVFAERA